MQIFQDEDKKIDLNEISMGREDIILLTKNELFIPDGSDDVKKIVDASFY